jgi:Domain of unknown function (DUF4844)
MITQESDKKIELLKKMKVEKILSEGFWLTCNYDYGDTLTVEKMKKNFSNCVDDLIKPIENNSSTKQIRSIIKRNLFLLNRYDFDTKDAEHIAETYFEIGEIVGVDVRFIDRWVYGFFIYTLIQLQRLRNKEKIIETLSQQCLDCKTPLQTFILKKDFNIKSSKYVIIRCNHCNGYNLLSLGDSIKHLRFGNYKFEEKLYTNEYSYEQALQRLEQIRHFRK